MISHNLFVMQQWLRDEIDPTPDMFVEKVINFIS